MKRLWGQKIDLYVLVVVILLMTGCGVLETAVEQAPTLPNTESNPSSAADQSEQANQYLSPIALTSETGLYGYHDPAIAIDGGGTIHLIYEDVTSDDNTKHFVAYRQLLADGSWSQPEEISPVEYFEPLFRSGDQYLLPNPDGDICAFWDAESEQGHGVHMRCLQNGIWSSPKYIGHIYNSRPAFASDGTAHVLEGNNQVEYKGIELSTGFGDAMGSNGAIFVDKSNNYHALWRSLGTPKGLLHSFSTDGGQTWSEVEQLDEQMEPDVVRVDSSGMAHLLSANSDMSYMTWTMEDGWGKPVSFGCCSGWADMVIDHNDIVHTVWSVSGGMIYRYQKEDSSWTEPLSLFPPNFENAPDDFSLTFTVDGQGVKHFAWEGEDDNIYYATMP